jgi:transcriptional adapter 2-alpha
MQMSAAERKRSKEERDLITRTKVFSRIQTSVDHEEFVDGMLCSSGFSPFSLLFR